MQRSLILAVLLWSLSACTQLHTQLRPLIEPGDRDHSQQLTQALTIYFAEAEHQLLGVIELTPFKTAMVVFTPEGVKLFSIVQEVDDLVIEKHPVLPEIVDPRQILADAQLVNWPIDTLRAALSSPWRVEQNEAVRRLWWRDEVVTEAVYRHSVHKWQTVELISPRAGYRLMVRAVGKETFD